MHLCFYYNKWSLTAQQTQRTQSTLWFTGVDLQVLVNGMTSDVLIVTRGSAVAEEPRDALRQLKYYGRFLTELLTRSSANPEEPCEHTIS